MGEIKSVVKDAVSDEVLVDVSDWSLDRLLDGVFAGEETKVMRTALDRIISTPSNCANSFQSSI